MKSIFYPVLAVVLLISSAFMSVSTNKELIIKDGYSIKFTSKDPSGIFKEFSGKILFDENDLKSSKFDLAVKVSSISTGNGMMNKKSLSEEWFDAAQFPDIKFVSTKIEKSDKGYSIIGNLSIKGTTKLTKIPTVYKLSGNDGSFSGVFYVKRSIFHLGHASDAVPDVLKVTFNVPVSKK
jgi:polyisoprenoid-binding protein YceI